MERQAPANPRVARLLAKPKPTARKEKPVDERPKSITAAELAFAETLVRTGDAKLARAEAVRLGETSPNSLTRRQNIRTLVEAALERQGVTLDRLAELHWAQLKATRPVLQLDGKVKQVADAAVRQRALELGYRIYGAFDAPLEKGANGMVRVTVNIAMKNTFENLRGEPLPDGVETISVEAEEVAAE